MRFENKVVLVTGGTRGIGRACAERFAREGALVVLCGRDAATAARVALEIGPNAEGAACDVTDSASVDTLVAAVEAKHGGIDVLVNNAGIEKNGLLARMKDADWDSVMRTNMTGAFHCCRAAARAMLRKRSGRIINISSVLGLRGQAGQTHYCASKAAIIGFSKAYAREVASRNITVNVVAPGYTVTDMTASIPGAMREDLLKAIPLGRGAESEEIAAAVAFFASDDAAYITGAVLCVDGGLAM
jgi:3-oxoacyl-[acyl-carrier protein] reductase